MTRMFKAALRGRPCPGCRCPASRGREKEINMNNTNPWTDILDNGNNSELAEELGLSQPAVHAWRYGNSFPSPEMQRKIIDAHPDVTSADILEHYETARGGSRGDDE